MPSVSAGVGCLRPAEGTRYDSPMTLTLEVTTELEHKILREARRKGLDAKGFVLGLLVDYLSQVRFRHLRV